MTTDNDQISTAEKQRRETAELNSRILKQAIRGAITRQAAKWGIRADQAQALLLDRRKVA